MNKLNTGFTYLAMTLLALLISGCGGGSSDDGDTSSTYSTTSTRGDYSEWNLSGSNLTVSWQSINATGLVDYTHTISANCAVADLNGVRSCTIATASCSGGALLCPLTLPSGSFDLMEVPGVALFVHTDDPGSGDQLHIGFVKNSSACTDDVSGDYTYIRTGLGINENFGIYRSDANFVDIIHADFGFDSDDGNDFTQKVIYRTGTESETLVDNNCIDGVRFRETPAPDSSAMRSMITASGLFVLDLPAGQGGLVSFKTSNAAAISDFANKSFGGISFPDNSDPEVLRATSGVLDTGKVELTAIVGSAAPQTVSIMDLDTSDGETSPTYANFSIPPAGYSTPVNIMDDTYATPSDIPGLFKIDGSPASDSGRLVVAAMKYNNKVIAVGMVYNWRDTFDINPATGLVFDSDGLYNTGNFLLFER